MEAVADPAIGELSDQFKRDGTLRSKCQWRTWPLHRRQRYSGIMDLIVAPLVGHGLAAQQTIHDRDELAEAADALGCIPGPHPGHSCIQRCSAGTDRQFQAAA